MMNIYFVCRNCTNLIKQATVRKYASKSVLNVTRYFSVTAGQQVSEQENAQKFKSSSFDAEEVQKFNDICDTWWNESGNFRALHSMNDLRVPLIRDALTKYGNESVHKTIIEQPLNGLKILDVGCGGGILSESLARLGATVTGVDAGQENIDIAEWHKTLDTNYDEKLNYCCSLVEDLVPTDANLYDGVVASEIIEHVADVNFFVEACCELVKPGGSLFFTTMNKTYMAYAFAIVAAEQVFKLVPPGTHDWNKFITPDDLQYMIKKNGLRVRLIHGMSLNPLACKWSWTHDTNINYALHAIKPTVPI